jgi:hypothetical protein
VLQTHVPEDCTNIFIGYGKQHDSLLLSGLATKKNNEYRFVDALEKAGLVYGEIIHGLFYKAIADVVLQAEGCEIYNYSTNTWSTCLEIGNLLSEQKKIYHLRSKTPEESSIKVIGTTIVQTKPFETLTNESEVQTECIYRSLKLSQLALACDLDLDTKGSNLSNYALRQRTQELLFQARKISEKFKPINPLNSYYCSNYIVRPPDINYGENNELKKKLKKFHTLLLDYIRENHLESDQHRVLVLLCNDSFCNFYSL